MIRILFVDDDPALLEITKLFLERNGDMSVETARSGTEALHILTATHYDVIVSDYDMPEMDGIALLKELRGRGDQTPFIVFTGKHRAHVVIDALNNSADFYLQKGSDPRTQFIELTEMVHKAVRRRQAEIALEERERVSRSGYGEQADLVCRFLPDGRFIFANEAFCRYFNVSFPWIVGKVFRTTIPDSEKELVIQHFKALTPADPVRLIAHHVILPDGSERLIQWSDRGIFSLDGRLIEYQSIGTDLTEYPRVMDTAAGEAVPEGPNTSVTSGKDGPLQPEATGTVSPPIVKSPPPPPNGEGEITTGEVSPFEGADTVPTAAIASPQTVISPNQAIAGTIENLPDPTFAIDTKGEVIAWNRPMAELTGVDAASIVGKGNYEYAIPLYGERRPLLIDLIPQPDNDSIQTKYPNLRREGDVITGQTGAARVRGEIRSLWGKAVPIYDRKGAMIGAIETVRDITALRIGMKESEGSSESLSPPDISHGSQKGLFERLFKKSAEGWYREGVDLYYRQGKYSEAITAFEHAIEGDASMTKAWMAKGMCQKELGRYSEALNSFDRVLGTNPSDEGALYHKGETFEKLGKTTGEMEFYGKSIQCFDAVLKIDSENVHAWNYRGVCFKELGILDEARRSFETAQQLIRKGKEIQNMQFFGLKVK